MPVPNGGEQRQHRSARDVAYFQLREWILDGVLEPGEAIRDVEVAENLGVSRTPVREALLQLAHEDLVEFRRGRATLVAPPRYERAPALFRTGGALDALAAGSAAGRLSPEALSHMRDVLDGMAANTDPAKLRDLDEQFHRIYYEAADNQVALSYLDQINLELRRLERRAFGESDIQHAAYDEHLAIWKALEQEDGAAAAAIARANWENSWRRIARRFGLGEFVAEPARR